MVTVKDFGAKGDGVTDDTAAFTNAYNSGPGEIIIPPSIGAYRIWYMSIAANQRWVGQGKPVLRANASTTAVVYLNGDGGELTGVEVDGNGLAQYCVNATNNPHQVVKRCKVYGATSATILAYLAGVSIKENDISGTGIKLDTDKPCSVLNNEIYSMTDNNGVFVDGQYTLNYGAHRHRIRGNHIHDIGATTGTGQTGNGIVVYQAGDVSIADNTIHDTRYSFVRLNGARRTDASGNICTTSGETGFFIEFAFQNVSVANNQVHGAAGNGIALTNVNDTSAGHGAAVTGNVLTGIAGAAISAEGAATITGNHIDSGGTAGIMLGYGGCWDIECVGNRITDSAPTPTLKVGIASELTSDGTYPFSNVDVSNNSVSRATLASYGGHTFGSVASGSTPYAWPHSYGRLNDVVVITKP